MSRWRDALLLAPAWLAIALILLVTLSIALPPGASTVATQHGDWAAVAQTPGGEWSTVLTLPGLTSRQGVPADARVVLSRSVEIEEQGSHALWIAHAFYALEVRWDGVVVGRSGDPDAFGSGNRSEASLLAVLPAAEPGTHQLDLVLRGDYGKAGITGEIAVGPVEEVLKRATQLETQRLALALGLSLLAFLPLTVAAGRRDHSAYLFYGLFSSTLALLSYSQSDVASHLFEDGLAVVRLHRLAEGPLAPMVICFLAHFVYGKLGSAHRAILALGALSSLLGLVAPPQWLYSLEVFQDATIAAGVPWFIWLLLQGVRLRIPGAWMLMVLTAAPALFGVIFEILLTHGYRTGSSHLYEASLLMVGGTGAALMLRDAMASARHERLVSSSVDAMVVLRSTGAIEDANPAAVSLLGPCIGHNLLEFVNAQDHPMVRGHVQRARQDGDRAEFRMVSERAVESVATPLDDDVSLLVLRDVTERRNIDKSLIHAARLETVGVLLGGIAHDFNNMLGTLLAHVGWLQARNADPPSTDRLQRMEGTIDRASHLTRRLLTIARGSSAELGPVDLATICRNAVELVEPTLNKNVGLHIDLPPELPPVHGDAAELEQVLVNLLFNARDALTLDGGRISLAVRPFALEDGALGVCAMVEDDGPGVADGLREQIFQPFVTTKGRGTGLGLAVASQVARDHHGRLWYEDRPGGGARFLLALRHADAVDEAPAPLPESRVVLLVEDERVLLEDYASAMRDAGYEVNAVGEAAAAAAWMLDHRPDILVTDVVMDGLSGIELATLCSHRYPEVPVLLVSGFIPDDRLAFSTWHRLHKPVRAARLVATVGSLRRRAERAARGDLDITRVTYLFPSLARLSATLVGFR